MPPLALFVGGPWDGKLLASGPRHGDTYRVPIASEFTPLHYAAQSQRWPQAFRTVEYHREVFLTPEQPFHFWVCDGTTADLFAALILAYHERARRLRRR